MATEVKNSECQICGDYQGRPWIREIKYTCPYCETIVTVKEVDFPNGKGTGINLLCPSCNRSLHIPSKVWCPACGNGLLENDKALEYIAKENNVDIEKLKREGKEHALSEAEMKALNDRISKLTLFGEPERTSINSNADRAATKTGVPAATQTVKPSKANLWSRLPLIPLVLVFFIISCLAAYFLESPEQRISGDAPLWPADPRTFNYEGHDYEVYNVPNEQGTQQLALVEKGRQESQFLDPANPSMGLTSWHGNWRALKRVWIPRWSSIWISSGVFLALLFSIGMLDSRLRRKNSTRGTVILAQGSLTPQERQQVRLSPLSGQGVSSFVESSPKSLQGECYQCHKPLQDMSAGVHAGAGMMAAMERIPYPCKSCGSHFCVKCVAQIKKEKNNICPYCGNNNGW